MMETPITIVSPSRASSVLPMLQQGEQIYRVGGGEEETGSSSSENTNIEVDRQGTSSASSSSEVASSSYYRPLLPPPPAFSAGTDDDHHLNHEHYRRRQQQQQRRSYRVNVSMQPQEDAFSSTDLRDEAWSCVVVLLTFWFFAASMTLVLGFYGSLDMSLGPNSSRLLEANSFFVQDIEVKEDDKPGPVLYGFTKPPPLDVQVAWSEHFHVTIPPNTHKEWVYQLNEGSELNISYSVSGSIPLTLVLAEGRENLVEWMEDPSYPATTLSWNVIQGNGSIRQKIYSGSDYYVAIGNMYADSAEVKLKVDIHALLYNTSSAYYNCELQKNLCGLKLFIFGANAAVLTTPSPKLDGNEETWYVKLSYGPRWITYFVGSGALTIIILLVFKIINKSRSTRVWNGDNSEVLAPERVPLISPKDDDLCSWGSSYDSISDDEDAQDDGPGVMEVKLLKDSEGSNTHHLCVICYDTPRDTFFLPCGHCAACFRCGSRIAEEAGICPICRRKLKKVRKIFSV